MTSNEIRNLPYLQWQNDWAWMETMKGKQWEQLIHRERSHHRKLTQQFHVKSKAVQMKEEITNARQYLYVTGFDVGSGQIDIVLTPEKQFLWKRSWHKRYQKAYDIDSNQGHIWYVTEGKEPYHQELHCEDYKGHNKWNKSGITSEVAVIDSYCYYIKTSNGIKSDGIYCCDALTGRGEKLIYQEKNPERSIGFIKAAYRTLYFISEDPEKSQIFRIQADHVIPLYPSSVSQIPLGCPPDSKEDVILVRESRHGEWKAHGSPLNKWRFPPSHQVGEIGWINVYTGHMITIYEGSESLWYCSPSHSAQLLLHLKAGAFFYNAWEVWEQSPYQRFMVQTPNVTPFSLHVFQNKLVRQSNSWPIQKTISFKPTEIHKWRAVSVDGTKVPYTVVYEKGITPKAVLIYVYGAYGLNTPVHWPNSFWYPLLKRKWAIVYAFVRGGGDHTNKWSNAARREYRHRSLDDYEAVIRAVQHRLHLTPSKTVMYGRSAGGVPVGGMVARWPNGELAGAAFTEVPYVDILRTSTNPDLPLTIGEYKEFGQPATILTHFHELLHVSPINSLPAQGAPGVFVLSRVGLLDRQVYAYESFKWIQRLRGYVSPEQVISPDPKQKYVTYERHEDHVYQSKTFPHFRALDLAVLDSWVEDKLQV